MFIVIPGISLNWRSLNRGSTVKGWLHSATLHPILRAIVAIKCGHLLNMLYNCCAQCCPTKIDWFYFCNTARNVTRNNFNGDHTMLFSCCLQYCVQVKRRVFFTYFCFLPQQEKLEGTLFLLWAGKHVTRGAGNSTCSFQKKAREGNSPESYITGLNHACVRIM